MEHRQLGKSDLKVAPLAFGGNVFGWTVDEKTSFELLDNFIASGFNLVDTADVYSSWVPGNKGGESETIIGKWMSTRKNRDKVVIATKVGGDMGEGKNNTKAYILKRVEDSLTRLQTDHIDLYQNHFDDAVTPVEETLEAFTTLVKQGKVRWIGASNITPERFRESITASERNGFVRYETLQPLYNLYEREDYEQKFEQFCLDNNIGVINYYALASGFLTGKYRSESDFGKSQRGGGMSKYLNEKGKKLLAVLDEVAAKYKATPASVSIAWLMSRPSITAPIASATKTSQIESFVQATELKLDDDDLAKLDIK